MASLVTDLELAQACLDGDAEALTRLDALISQVARKDDVRQAVRYRVVVERRLSQFDGKSSLRRWLTTVAARLEIDLSRKDKEVPVESKMLDALIPSGAHLELQLVSQAAREALLKGLRDALQSLPERDRLFVQLAYLDGLTLTAIGKLYNVAPSTAMRAIDRSLEKLREAIRVNLKQLHQLGDRSVESLVRTGLA